MKQLQMSVKKVGDKFIVTHRTVQNSTISDTISATFFDIDHVALHVAACRCTGYQLVEMGV